MIIKNYLNQIKKKNSDDKRKTNEQKFFLCCQSKDSVAPICRRPRVCTCSMPAPLLRAAAARVRLAPVGT